MEVELATHAFFSTASRDDSQTTHAIIPRGLQKLGTKSEKWNKKSRLAYLCQCSTSAFENSRGVDVLSKDIAPSITWRKET